MAGRQTEVVTPAQAGLFHRRPLSTMRTVQLQLRRQRVEARLHLRPDLRVAAEPAARTLSTRQRSSETILLQLVAKNGHDEHAGHSV